ncbi:MAG: hypothetical protein GKS06_06070 [Acidobacteria bacterium]|nr:hypothetical protein [Acidobacteriota bacterium]
MTSHRRARTSTPGKLILMGEHAAVYGAPALVTAVGLRVRTDLERSASAAVELQLPALDHEETIDAERLLEYTAEQRTAWKAFAAEPDAANYQALQDGEPARLARIALGECAEQLGELPGTRLRVESDLPIGSGFGSSAAAAVGVASAAIALGGSDVRWSAVGPIAMEIERRQHGSPSGVDAATVFHGGVLAAMRHEGELSFEPLTARADLLREFRVVHTGTPAEATGTVVAAVGERRRTAREWFETMLTTMADTTGRFEGLLIAPETVAEDLIDPIQVYQRTLEEIGVVPGPVAELVRRIERRGGAAKLSGAGGLSGSGAGCLLVLLPEDGDDLMDGLNEVVAPLAAEGMRVEQKA